MLLNTVSRKVFQLGTASKRAFSLSTKKNAQKSCKLLVVGGGSGGCAIAAKFAKALNKHNLIVLEPSSDHYYQPLFTLIGGGMHTLEDARRNEKDVLPKDCTWVQSKAVKFDPKNNIVHAENGDAIEYDYLLIAVGLETRYDQIPGLLEGLSIPGGGVCSNYSAKYVNRTFEALSRLDSGNAIFTFPNSPVKCPGAPQKICYIADHYLRKHKKRDRVQVIYNTSLPVIFGVKKYADALWKVVKERNIQVNTRTNLVSIDNKKNEATFVNLDNPEKKQVLPFSMLHVTPPMTTPECIKTNRDIANEAGFLEVDKLTLQHVKYPNIFGIGDCTSSPNSKTAAAVAAQSVVVHKNLQAMMNNKQPTSYYDGYASCPLVTGYDKCILAEFDYDLNPLETFPFSQDKEMYSMFILKNNIMPSIYWKLMMNGHWNGPEMFRNLMHFNLGSKGRQTNV